MIEAAKIKKLKVTAKERGKLMETLRQHNEFFGRIRPGVSNHCLSRSSQGLASSYETG